MVKSTKITNMKRSVLLLLFLFSGITCLAQCNQARVYDQFKLCFIYHNLNNKAFRVDSATFYLLDASNIQVDTLSEDGFYLKLHISWRPELKRGNARLVHRIPQSLYFGIDRLHCEVYDLNVKEQVKAFKRKAK